METKKIRDFQPGDLIQSFFLVKAAEYKTTSTNKSYLDLTLVDSTGEINAKIWDHSTETEPKCNVNMLVRIRGSVSEWQSRLQLKIDKIRVATQEDALNIGDFVPVAPYSPEAMYGEIEKYISMIENADIGKIVSTLVAANKEKLLLYPAAKQNHHAVRSGLLYHITTMLKMGEKVSEVYVSLNRDLLFAGIILHDIAKIAEMNASELGIVSEYTVEGELLGHIIQGIKMIDQTAVAVGADPEASLLLQHMVLSHHYEPEFGSPKRPMIPEAEILHYLDIMDARMYDMGRTLEKIEDGHFSDKVWLLNNRKLYKSSVKSSRVEKEPNTLF
ncbi:3'-5' exoribonuclease YhaM family protein [Pelosinus propionicus]|uniref:3'-5' exoribonuclease n=1 Tax=Pelosinus propionicus DSM 13327 TaxID=1123291 RepID=A0A1I4J145_9FIRM|nr:HD domain-containing protein [Pelosinus propionicus]SFL60289.1 3'-5' exoribonuclease [Pelosinus propionicus DSM 13327]